MLENILYNVSHPKGGNIEYYQGLNYIVSYYLNIFENDFFTFNVVMYVLKKHYLKFLDKRLTKLRKIFYYLKKYVEIYIPDLSYYLENEVRLDIDIIFAPWVLTIFTSST